MNRVNLLIKVRSTAIDKLHGASKHFWEIKKVVLFLRPDIYSTSTLELSLYFQNENSQHSINHKKGKHSPEVH